MNRGNIKKIVESNHPLWEKFLIVELANDKMVIPMILEILESERKINEELLTDSNAELSRALVTIIDKNYGNNKGKNKAHIDRGWVADQIKAHYLKWKERIKCCFKVEGLP